MQWVKYLQNFKNKICKILNACRKVLTGKNGSTVIPKALMIQKAETLIDHTFGY